MIMAAIQPTRTVEDHGKHVQQTIATDPYRWTYTGKPLDTAPPARYIPPHRRMKNT
jgi:hypothetical protein